MYAPALLSRRYLEKLVRDAAELLCAIGGQGPEYAAACNVVTIEVSF